MDLVGLAIPVRDASERDDGTFSRSDFRWDRKRGVYICPNNKVLHTSGTVHESYKLRYLASELDCETVRSKCDAVPKSRRAKFPGMFMNMPAT